jgi:hypothetical protein
VDGAGIQLLIAGTKIEGIQRFIPFIHVGEYRGYHFSEKTWIAGDDPRVQAIDI